MTCTNNYKIHKCWCIPPPYSVVHFDTSFTNCISRLLKLLKDIEFILESYFIVEALVVTAFHSSRNSFFYWKYIQHAILYGYVLAYCNRDFCKFIYKTHTTISYKHPFCNLFQMKNSVCILTFFVTFERYHAFVDSD